MIPRRPLLAGGMHTPSARSPRRDWRPDDAIHTAWRLGLGTLTDRHWRVITACREEAVQAGQTPGRSAIEKITGLTRIELGQLFPGRTEILIARIAGLPLPQREGPTADKKEE